MPQDVLVRINLGESAPLEVVSSTVCDLATVCDVGSELQRRVSRAEMLRQVIQEVGPEGRLYEDWFWDLPPSRRPYGYPAGILFRDSELPLGRELSRRLAGLQAEWEADADILVRELHYRNPFDAQLVLVSGGVVLGLLRMIRDWSSNRRIGQVLADDVADEALKRKELRRRVLQGIADGDIPLPEQWLDPLLSDRAVRAFDRLSRRAVELPSLDDGGDRE